MIDTPTTDQRAALLDALTLLGELSRLTRNPDMRTDSICVHWHEKDGERAHNAFEVVLALLKPPAASQSERDRESARLRDATRRFLDVTDVLFNIGATCDPVRYPEHRQILARENEALAELRAALSSTEERDTND